MCYIFFLTATFISQITMLNMLIAVMADKVPMEIEVFTSLEEAEAWLSAGEGGASRSA